MSFGVVYNMIERHYYESKLQLGDHHHDLSKAKPALLQYLEQNSKPVFEYHSLEKHDLWGFHQNGISINLQTTSLKANSLDFIDVKLISEVTPTQDLEDMLTKLIEPFKI